MLENLDSIFLNNEKFTTEYFFNYLNFLEALLVVIMSLRDIKSLFLKA